MNQIYDVIRRNIRLVLLFFILLIGYFFLQNKQSTVSLVSPSFGEASSGIPGTSAVRNFGYDQKTSEGIMPIPPIDVAPQGEITNRMVIQNSNLSLLVENVKKTTDEILATVTTSGGYMVSSDISGDNESPTGTVVVRIPQRELDKSLSTFRSFGIRVVSEHLEGFDVTDQFVDVEKRIAILQKAEAQFQDLRDKSKEISDITQLTQQILNIQSQIDSYRGQEESLSKNAAFGKVTVYLSTDELSLPFQPNEPFRPSVIFKLAIRSVMTTVRQIVGGIIWISVYGILWIPLLIVAFVVMKLLAKSKKS